MENALFWHRLYFAFTITYHYLFPQLTMGLPWVLVYWKWRALQTGDERFNRAARFWAKIFGLNFAVGVVTGIPMEFDRPGQQVDGPDAAGCDGPCPVGEFVVDVGGGHHRFGAFDAGPVLQAAGDAALAAGELATDTVVHSKTSWWRTPEGREAPRLFAET